jgi:hypothetical protein
MFNAEISRLGGFDLRRRILSLEEDFILEDLFLDVSKGINYFQY